MEAIIYRVDERPANNSEEWAEAGRSHRIIIAETIAKLCVVAGRIARIVEVDSRKPGPPVETVLNWPDVDINLA